MKFNKPMFHVTPLRHDLFFKPPWLRQLSVELSSKFLYHIAFSLLLAKPINIHVAVAVLENVELMVVWRKPTVGGICTAVSPT